MYSKYLDYTQAAVRAHQAAQVQNDQKDILISHLKSDVYQLRQLQGDFLRLNGLIMALQQKYSLLLDQKQRSQKEQKIKSDIDKNSIIDLKQQIQLIRLQLQKATLQIQDLMRQNTAMKRMSDTRINQIQNIKYQIKGLQNKNNRIHQQNKDINNSIKLLKQERKKLQDQCEMLDNALDSNIAKLKSLEKHVRNSQSTNARLDKTLHQAQNDNIKLVAELKQKSQQAKRAQNKLNGLRNTIEQLKLTHQTLLQQAEKNKTQAALHTANLTNQLTKGKQLTTKLTNIQTNIRIQQSQLQTIVNQQQKLRKQYYIGLDTNKTLNNQIDKILILIQQYQQVNKQLLDQLEIYIDQDQQARTILNRKQQMREIIQTTLRKIAVSSQPIKHLKY